MKISDTSLTGAYILENQIFRDERGNFTCLYIEEDFIRKNLNTKWPQINCSISFKKRTLRGLHFQYPPFSQIKLIRVIQGSIFDVIVDLRVNSPSYKEHFTITLQKPEEILWVPPGLAHGFYNLAETSEFEYKVTDYYYPDDERTLIFSSNEIGIVWPFYDFWGYPEPVLSYKDKRGLSFKDCEKYEW